MDGYKSPEPSATQATIQIFPPKIVRMFVLGPPPTKGVRNALSDYYTKQENE